MSQTHSMQDLIRQAMASQAISMSNDNKTPDDETDAANDPTEFAKNFADLSAKSQHMLSELVSQKMGQQPAPLEADPLNVAEAFSQLMGRMSANPTLMFDAQAKLWQAQYGLWHDTVRRMMGEEVEPAVAPQKGDKRWRHPDWAENLIFDFIKQSYLVTANWLQETVEEVDGFDPQTKKKLSFYTKQMADAMSPTNFALTNPEVLRETMATNGQNLMKGMSHLIEDLERGKGQVWIRQTDLEHFKVGENIAVTPGSVIYQNDLMQLIQYEPATKTVYEKPLLILPPWINKFYILDLRPENSFIKWAVSKGYTVFVVSWANPDASHSKKSFEDYMHEGVFDALDAIEKATGAKSVNAIGYCIGGTLLASSLGVMAKRGDKRINSATFFAAQVDFSDAGDLAIFVDEKQIKSMESQMRAAGGYLEGVSLANTFNLLRANDLVWSFVVNNYLLGKDPKRFDLLYWNSDQTRMPVEMQIFYLREFYLENKLANGDLVMDGEAVDLSEVKIPLYIQSSKDDHIAPTPSVYRGAQLYGGPVRFICAGSGHIAGVINHPDAKKYMFWTNDELGDDLDTWWEGAKETPGSWWGDWHSWLSKKSGKKIEARQPGDQGLDVIEPAPGSYVLVKCE